MKERDVHVCSDTQPAALASPGPNGPVIRPGRCRRRAECRMHTAPSSLAMLLHFPALLACICHYTACKEKLCEPDTAAGSHDFSCLPLIDSPSPQTRARRQRQPAASLVSQLHETSPLPRQHACCFCTLCTACTAFDAVLRYSFGRVRLTPCSLERLCRSISHP